MNVSLTIEGAKAVVGDCRSACCFLLVLTASHTFQCPVCYRLSEGINGREVQAAGWLENKNLSL